MPFAVVEGEPVTELPRDLYIPPYALEVFLEAFEGPLDLLLYLIRRQNLDILDIPIAEISRQYVQYIELMTEMQFELAGEYLVMAATLAEIKSRMLLPRSAEDEEDEEDPRAELVRRLQEYERFKKAAGDIDALERMERDVLQASVEAVDRNVTTKLPDITLKELLIVFKEVLDRSTMFAHHHVKREPLSVRERMSNILVALQAERYVDFIRLFDPLEGRIGVTVTFLAILELLSSVRFTFVQPRVETTWSCRKPPRTKSSQWKQGQTKSRCPMRCSMKPSWSKPPYAKRKRDRWTKPRSSTSSKRRSSPPAVHSRSNACPSSSPPRAPRSIGRR
jgi:segregation and condensation protein A